MNVEKTVRNLELRGYRVRRFATGREAAAYLAEEINGTAVGIGGSKTADQLGLYELLTKNNQVYWHWKAPGPATIEKANAAPVYITGANAMTEDGEIVNIDGRGNRLAGQVYGDKRLYIVTSTDKICPDLASAIDRAHNIAAVENCKRFPNKPPCQIDDKCHDCRSKDRICRAMLVHMMPMMGMSAEVVLIDEKLGM